LPDRCGGSDRRGAGHRGLPRRFGHHEQHRPGHVHPGKDLRGAAGHLFPAVHRLLLCGVSAAVGAHSLLFGSGHRVHAHHGAPGPEPGLVPEIMVCVLSGACALVNGITPTSGTLMGAIAICRIEYTTWVKYIWKPLAMMLVLHIVILSVGMAVL